MKDKFLTFIKNDKVIIALCVFALTTLSIGVSYSAFFTVKTNKNNQTVTTGTLDVTYDKNQSTSLTKSNMQPLNDIDGLNQTEASVIYIQNNGTLKSNYTLSLGYDMESFLGRDDYKDTDILTPLEYIKVAVYEWKSIDEQTLIAGPISIADLLVLDNFDDTRYNRYALLFDDVGPSGDVSAIKTYQVKIWLSDEATSYASETYFYINSEIKAEADNTKTIYSFDGVLNYNDEALANANISIQNGSYQTTTDDNGLFHIENLLPGTYNLKITKDDKLIESALKITEGNIASFSLEGNTFVASSDDLRKEAYLNNTSINTLRRLNNIGNTANTYKLNVGSTYNNHSTIVLNGGEKENLGKFNITTNENTITNITQIYD